MLSNLQFMKRSIALNQFYILTMDEIIQLFRRKRALLSFLIYVGFILLSLILISYCHQWVLKMIPLLPLPSDEKEMLFNALKSIEIPDSMIRDYPLLGYSWPSLFYFFCSVFFFPFLIPLISCDMISQDLSTGTQRFILFRVPRWVYFWSKTLAHFLVYLFFLFLLIVFLTVYSLVTLKNSQLISISCDSFFLSLRLLPVMFVFLSLTQAISSIIQSPMKGLLLNYLMLLFMLILLTFVPQISLFYYPLWQGLFSFDPVLMMTSVAGFVFWSFLLFGGSFFVFLRKNL